MLEAHSRQSQYEPNPPWSSRQTGSSWWDVGVLVPGIDPQHSPAPGPGHGLFDLDVAVLYLAAVALEADGAGFRHLQLGFQDFAVAGAAGHASSDYDPDRPVVLQVLVGAGRGIVAALMDVILKILLRG